MQYSRVVFSVLFFIILQSAHPAERVTADYFYQRADSIACSVLVESYSLLILRSNTVDSSGKSEYWEYIFQNNDKSIRIYFSIDSLSYKTGPPWTGSARFGDGWIDSDSALAIAEKNGGREFRSKYPNIIISADLGGESGLPIIEWIIVYKSTIFQDVKLTISVKAYTGQIYYKWNPKIVSYFPLTSGNKWSYYSIETGGPEGPIAFNRVTDSIRIQGRSYFNYVDGGISFPYRSDSTGHVYRLIKDKEILWFDFTKAEGDSYWVKTEWNNYKVITTDRNATVNTLAGKFTNCLSLYFNAPGMIDGQSEFYFAENVGIVKQGWAHNILLGLYDANINGKQYPDTTTKVAVSVILPTNSMLFQNFPNPFNSTTFISFNLPVKSTATLQVFDALGRKVSNIVFEELPAGFHKVSWNGVDLPSGVYFYRLQANNISLTRKLILIR